MKFSFLTDNSDEKSDDTQHLESLKKPDFESMEKHSFTTQEDFFKFIVQKTQEISDAQEQKQVQNHGFLLKLQIINFQQEQLFLEVNIMKGVVFGE